MYLAEDMIESNFVPVCVVTQTPGNASGVLLSFGENEIQTLGILRVLEMIALPRDKCKAELQNYVQSSHFCAQTPENTGICRGDSGGGFVFKHGTKWTLSGIVSSSLVQNRDEACDEENNSIFVNVLSFLSWIPQLDANRIKPTILTSMKPPTKRPTRRPNLSHSYPQVEAYSVSPSDTESDEWTG